MQNLDAILEKENKAIGDFFNLKTFAAPPLPDWINNELVQYWDSLFFNIHYLPQISLDQKSNLPLWADRPSQHFYQKIEQGRLKAEAKTLPGKWILVDARNKPQKKIF